MKKSYSQRNLKTFVSLLFFIFTFSIQAQDFANRDFYLIDSLVIEDLSKQDKYLIDSMLTIYHSADDDTIQLNSLAVLIDGCWDYDVWPKYNDYMQFQSQKILKNPVSDAIKKAAYKFEGSAYMNRTVLYKVKGPLEKAKGQYELAIKSYENCGYTEGKGLGLMGLAIMHSHAGEYLQSMRLGERAIELIKTDSPNGLGIYHDMAAIQHKVGNEKEAEYYSRVTYAIAIQQNNALVESDCLNDFVLFNIRKGNYESALDTAFLALKSTENLGDPLRIVKANYRFIEVYMYLKKYDEALLWAMKTDSINEKVKSIQFEIKTDILKTKLFLLKNDLEKAENAGLNGLKLAEDNNVRSGQIKLLESLAKIAKRKSQSDLAAEYLFQLIDLKDEAAKDKSAKIGIKQAAQYQYKKQKEIDDLKNKQQLELAEQQKQKSKIALISVCIIVLLIGLFALFIFNRLKLIRSQKTKLDDAYLKLEASKKNELAISNLKALQSQMNPHFIFNALNSVQDLVLLQDIRNSNKYLGKFSDLIRKILLSSKKQFITLKDEIEVLSLYLDLEKLRFGEEFFIELKCNISDDSQREIMLPAMFIQPYIENAIKHGLFHKIGVKKLKLYFELNENYLECIVEDNGVGQKKAEEIKNKNSALHAGFSTEAINDRIHLLNETVERKIVLKVEDLFSDDEPAGTKVTLLFPK